MDTARQAVEAFKKNAAHQEIHAIRGKMKLPEDIANKGYNERIEIERRAFDDAVATELGITLTEIDHDQWVIERGQILAKDWASKLPDAE